MRTSTDMSTDMSTDTSTKKATSAREAPDPNVVCVAADVADRRSAPGLTRHASTGANAAAGDAETALLAGAP